MHAPEPSSTTTVTRPPPGLARGVWEAPVGAFYLAGILLVIAGAALLSLRLNLFRKR